MAYSSTCCCSRAVASEEDGEPLIQLHCIQENGAQTQTLDLRFLKPAIDSAQLGSQPPEAVSYVSDGHFVVVVVVVGVAVVFLRW